jgi:cytochrome P450
VIRRYIDLRRKSGDTGDLISMLISAVDDEGKGMDAEQLRDEALTLITAGHETTAVAMTMTMYLLSQNPAVEVKLHQELDRVLGDRDPTFEDLGQLTYTDQVITESMRLLPPVWGIGREALQDTEIGGYPIKQGAQVFVTQWTVHRDSRFFADPESFQPQRWTPQFRKQLPHYAYFPFGGGPRICVGKRFAMMEAVLILATISRRYSLRLLPGQTLDLMPSITIRPRNGLRMVAQKRPT